MPLILNTFSVTTTLHIPSIPIKCPAHNHFALPLQKNRESSYIPHPRTSVIPHSTRTSNQVATNHTFANSNAPKPRPKGIRETKRIDHNRSPQSRGNLENPIPIGILRFVRHGEIAWPSKRHSCGSVEAAGPFYKFARRAWSERATGELRPAIERRYRDTAVVDRSPGESRA